MKLGDLKGSEEELAAAIKLEGKTPGNLALKKQLSKAMALEQKQQKVASEKGGYISDQWDPNAQPVQMRPRPEQRSYTNSGRSRRRTSTRMGGKSYPTAHRPDDDDDSGFSPSAGSYSSGGGSSYSRGPNRQANAQVEARRQQQRARIQAQNQAIIRQHSSGGYRPPSAPSFPRGGAAPSGPRFP